jgi:hypothetical protein
MLVWVRGIQSRFAGSPSGFTSLREPLLSSIDAVSMQQRLSVAIFGLVAKLSHGQLAADSNGADHSKSLLYGDISLDRSLLTFPAVD